MLGSMCGGCQMDEFVQRAADGAAAWQGVAMPNEAAQRMTAELAGLIAAFEALRGTLRFEDEPASFEAALRAAKE